MAYGVEFLRQRLSMCLTEPLQQTLSMQCLPEGPGIFVDRIDVTELVTFGAPAGSPGAIEAAMAIQVFLVSLADLAANPNQSPPMLGTTGPQVALRVRLEALGTKFTASVPPTDLAGTGLPSPLREQLARSLSAAANETLDGQGFDLAELMASFGLPEPLVARTASTPSSIVVEADPTGPAGQRLASGQEWGLFMDGQPALDFALGKLPALLRGGLISTSAVWAPVGGTARVTAQARLDIGLFVFLLPLDIRLSLAPAPPGGKAELRVDLSWDVEVDAMSFLGVPVSLLLKLAGFPGVAAALASEGFAEVLELGLDGAAELADGSIDEALTGVGAVRTGQRSWSFSQELPEQRMFGVKLSPTSLVAVGAGMTLGGTVAIAKVSREPMSVSTRRFGRPFFPTNCRASGGKRPSVKAEQVRWFAGTTLYSMGRFCDARFWPPNPVAADVIEPPLGSTNARTDAFGFDLDVNEVNLMQAGARLLVRTSRGTRLVDFGKPVPAQIQPDGTVTNVIGHIWNCLTYSTEDKRSLVFGNEPVPLTKEDVLPPKEDPEWLLLLRDAWGLDVQVIAVQGLEPGETVIYESATHRVQVAADRDGRALLPGLAPTGPGATPARMLRLNQGALTKREVRLMQSTALQGGGLLRPLSEGEVLLDQGGLRRRPKWAEALRSMHIGPMHLGALSTGFDGHEAALNPQPLPPEPPPELGELNPQPLPPEPPPEEHPLVKALGLREVQAVLTVPGVRADQLAVAVMTDGRKVVLDGSAERARVAGSFQGPIGRIVLGAGHAVAQAGGQLRLFEIGT